MVSVPSLVQFACVCACAVVFGAVAVVGAVHASPALDGASAVTVAVGDATKGLASTTGATSNLWIPFGGSSNALETVTRATGSSVGVRTVAVPSLVPAIDTVVSIATGVKDGTHETLNVVDTSTLGGGGVSLKRYSLFNGALIASNIANGNLTNAQGVWFVDGSTLVIDGRMFAVHPATLAFDVHIAVGNPTKACTPQYTWTPGVVTGMSNDQVCLMGIHATARWDNQILFQISGGNAIFSFNTVTNVLAVEANLPDGQLSSVVVPNPATGATDTTTADVQNALQATVLPGQRTNVREGFYMWSRPNNNTHLWSFNTASKQFQTTNLTGIATPVTATVRGVVSLLVPNDDDGGADATLWLGVVTGSQTIASDTVTLVHWTDTLRPLLERVFDECMSPLTNGCYIDNFQTCVDEVDGYRCDCPDGANRAGMFCSDINECATSNGGCHFKADCINNFGAPRVCACQPGFVGDGEYGCNNINECALNVGVDANPHQCAQFQSNCSDTVGSFQCTCSSMWTTVDASLSHLACSGAHGSIGTFSLNDNVANFGTPAAPTLVASPTTALITINISGTGIPSEIGIDVTTGSVDLVYINFGNVDRSAGFGLVDNGGTTQTIMTLGPATPTSISIKRVVIEGLVFDTAVTAISLLKVLNVATLEQITFLNCQLSFDNIGGLVFDPSVTGTNIRIVGSKFALRSL